MADSDAVRSRRKRAHAANDHRWCKRCAAIRSAGSPAETLAAVPDPSRDLDVRESLTALARRLEDAHVADPANAIVARVLKDVLLAIEAAEPAAADPMDELREMAARVS